MAQRNGRTSWFILSLDSRFTRHRMYGTRDLTDSNCGIKVILRLWTSWCLRFTWRRDSDLFRGFFGKQPAVFFFMLNDESESFKAATFRLSGARDTIDSWKEFPFFPLGDLWPQGVLLFHWILLTRAGPRPSSWFYLRRFPSQVLPSSSFLRVPPLPLLLAILEQRVQPKRGVWPSCTINPPHPISVLARKSKRWSLSANVSGWGGRQFGWTDERSRRLQVEALKWTTAGLLIFNDFLPPPILKH